MVLMLVEYLHSGRQLLVRGEGVGGPFLGRNEGLRAPFFGDGPPTSTSFLKGSSPERATRSALRTGSRMGGSHLRWQTPPYFHRDYAVRASGCAAGSRSVHRLRLCQHTNPGDYAKVWRCPWISSCARRAASTCSVIGGGDSMSAPASLPSPVSGSHGSPMEQKRARFAHYSRASPTGKVSHPAILRYDEYGTYYPTVLGVLPDFLPGHGKGATCIGRSQGD